MDFWNFTGPQPISGDSKKKYDQLKKGLLGQYLMSEEQKMLKKFR